MLDRITPCSIVIFIDFLEAGEPGDGFFFILFFFLAFRRSWLDVGSSVSLYSESLDESDPSSIDGEYTSFLSELSLPSSLSRKGDISFKKERKHTVDNV